MINARLPDVLPPAFSWPQHIPQTLPGHMEKVGKRGHKTICIPAESAGNVWKSIQIRAFNSFASERSRVRIPSGPPKINHPQGWLYFYCGPRDSRFMPRRGKSLQVHQTGIGRTPISSAAVSPLNVHSDTNRKHRFRLSSKAVFCYTPKSTHWCCFLIFCKMKTQ